MAKSHRSAAAPAGPASSSTRTPDASGSNSLAMDSLDGVVPEEGWFTDMVTEEAPRASFTGDPPLRRGDSGARVEALQCLLNENGASLDVDGDFGKRTRAAVIAFQRNKGLAVDGIAGRDTASALSANSAPVPELDSEAAPEVDTTAPAQPTAPTVDESAPSVGPARDPAVDTRAPEQPSAPAVDTAPTEQGGESTSQLPELPSISGSPPLRWGMRGTEVEKLQMLLNNHGALIKVDGGFGESTHLAVKAFQGSNGLEPDGVVGPATAEALGGTSSSNDAKDWGGQGGPYSDQYGQTSADERLNVDRGQLTFDAEGTEGGAYHTRTAHWPGGASGVTIGRGYDLGQHSKSDIETDMAAAGISAGDIAKFQPASGLTHEDAKNWLSRNAQGLPEISLEQQELLFDIVYNDLAKDVERISGNYARIVSEREGGEREDYEVDWDNLHPALRDLVVDLRYRGDYTPTTRKEVQPLLIANDLRGMSEHLSDRSKWSSVPRDRFNRRAAYLKEAVLNGSTTIDLAKDGPVEEAGASTEVDGAKDAPAPEETTAPTEGTLDTSVRGKSFVITASALWVRSAPDTEQDNKLGRLLNGERVQATGRQNGWLQIDYNSQVAWVSEEFTRELTQDQLDALSGSGAALSGRDWYNRANANGWKNSTSFDDLEAGFGRNCRNFVNGLRASGAKVELTAGLRHKKRAYLMHYAWHVSKGSKTPAAANTACRAEGINIEWDHGHPNKSRKAAGDLVAAFGLVHAASLTSNHMSGQAMDMKITNVPANLNIGGKSYQAGPKRSGVLDEDKVDHIGRDMGVIWYGAADWVHWSATGR